MTEIHGRFIINDYAVDYTVKEAYTLEAVRELAALANGLKKTFDDLQKEGVIP